MKILECSSRGDKRFSAFYAKIRINGVLNSIEGHYQSVKRRYTGNFIVTCRKGEKVDIIIINNKKLEPKFLTPFYKLMWVDYLNANPDLVEYAKTYDDFNDMFKGKAINCQADVIRQYVKEGVDNIMNEPLVQELLEVLSK